MKSSSNLPVLSTLIPCLKASPAWIALAAIAASLSVLPAAAQSALVVPTVAALRALNVARDPGVFTNDSVAIVIDYYPPGFANGYGRGGGLFRWIQPASSINSPAEDGGRFIYPNVNGANPGVWERMLQGEAANVKMWGAKGNGVNIDYTNIQNAMLACQDSTWCGELLFPVGNYLITNTLRFNAEVLHLRGESLGDSKIVMQSNTMADILQTGNAVNALNGGTNVDWDHNLLVENLKLYYQTNLTGGHNRRSSCLVVCKPGEANCIRNVQTEYGAFGIRCLGAGAPGLHVENASLHDAAIAGLSIEPIPGFSYDEGAPVTLLNVSGDMHDNTDSANASLIRFLNSTISGEIAGLKAEGDFGGGVIQYTYVPANTPTPQTGWGMEICSGLDIHNCTFNGGPTISGIWYATDFVRLMSSGVRTPVVTLRGNVVNVGTLINDELTGRTVQMDLGTIWAGRLPIVYDAVINGQGTKNSKLVVGQTALTTFVPGTNGWYRVLEIMPPDYRISGRLNWKAPANDNSEMQVDVNLSGAGETDTWLNVTRSTGLNYNPPIITRARAYELPNAPMGVSPAGVDLYVGNATTNTAITVGWELNGSIEPGEPNNGMTQLTGQVQFLGTQDVPANSAHLSITNTFRQ